jgi:hypothetical protein
MATTEVTTRDRWHFTPYCIERRGMQNIPTEYLKETVWGIIEGVEGYYTKTPSPTATTQLSSILIESVGAKHAGKI